MDKELHSLQIRAKNLTEKFNRLSVLKKRKSEKIIKELIPNIGDNFWMNRPFNCDYGLNITIGKNFYSNYNLTILDVGKVTIGDNVMFGPNVSLYAAGHPLDPEIRATLYEFGLPINIGNNVWLGGNVVVLPGISIGNNAVIGAGSVVTKDIPDNVLACGNPCKVVREINENDKKFYTKNYQFDDEALKIIKKKIELK